jgi:hypothetical protein
MEEVYIDSKIIFNERFLCNGLTKKDIKNILKQVEKTILKNFPPKEKEGELIIIVELWEKRSVNNPKVK